MSNRVCVMLLPEFNNNDAAVKLLTQELLEKVKPGMFVVDRIKPTNEDLATINNRFIMKGIDRNIKNIFKPGDEMYTMFFECDREKVLYALYSDSRKKQKIEKIFNNKIAACDMVLVFKDDESKVLADFYKEYVNKRTAANKATETASV